MQQEHRKTQPSLRLLLMALSALALSNSCATKPLPVTVYVGDPANDGIFTLKGQPEIKCSDPKFSDFVCLQKDDFQSVLLHDK